MFHGERYPGARWKPAFWNSIAQKRGKKQRSFRLKTEKTCRMFQMSKMNGKLC